MGGAIVMLILVHFGTFRWLKVVLSVLVLWGFPFRELFKVGFA